MYIKKKLFLLGICFLFCQLLSAQSVSVEQAEQMANAFWASRTANKEIKNTTANKVTPIGGKQQPAMYAFSRDSSWVLIAGDERVKPILAFSDEKTGGFPAESDMPPAMKYLLEWYENQIESFRNSAKIIPKDSGWIFSREDPNINIMVPVPPLLVRNDVENGWGQEYNQEWDDALPEKSYNKFCPTPNGCSHHAPVGCIAVAMSQVMWYWQWPQGAVVKNDDGAYLLRDYDWSLMPSQLFNNTSIAEANMIATLLHDAGVTLAMIYGCSSSMSFPENIVMALNGSFNYHADTVIERKSYSNSTWLQLLKNELDHWRPVIYNGRSLTSGRHTFVLDGYTYDNHFHTNFGWNGWANGFYLLDSIGIENETGFFNLDQLAIRHIYPNYPTCSAVVVPSSEVWQTNFSKFNGGGMTIGNRTIAGNQKGIIYSGDYVQLTNGFHISAGAEVRIGIRDIDCDVPILQLNVPDNMSHRKPQTNEHNATTTVSVSPNPVTDILSIRSTEALQLVRIYDLNGQCLLQTAETEINVSMLPTGLYLLTAHTSSGKSLQTKFIKQ